MTVMTRRILAFLFDMTCIVVPAVILLFSGPQFDPQYLLAPSIRMFSAWGVLSSVIVGWGGILLRDLIFGKTSLGKRIFGLRIVRAPAPNAPVDAPLTAPTAGSVILRNVAAFVAFVDLLLILVNRGVSLGDSLSGTRVVLRKQKES